MRRSVPYALATTCVVTLGVAAGLLLGSGEAESARSARLRRMVVLGDSILAGYSNGGFVESGVAGQVHSAPAYVARRARVRLPQPLMERPGVPPQYKINDQDGDGQLDPGDIVRRTDGIGFRDDPDAKVRNLAVPGEDITSITEAIEPDDLARRLVAGNAGGREILKFLILGLPLRDDAVSQPSRALELNPTFMLVWIGNNDVLGIGTGTNPNNFDLPPAQFGQRFRALLGTLANAGVDMAVGNLPDVTAIAALRRAAGEVTACAQPNGMQEPVAADDLLSIGLDRSRLPVPPCDKVLTAAERAVARANIQAFNAEIAAAVAETEAARGVGIALIDSFALFDDIATNGVDVDGNGTPDLSTRYLGGIFSLDGIHPTRTGNAIIANAIIDAVNARFGEAIPPVSIAKVASRDPLVGNRFQPAGEPPFGLFSEQEIEDNVGTAAERVARDARDIGRDLRDELSDILDFFGLAEAERE